MARIIISLHCFISIFIIPTAFTQELALNKDLYAIHYGVQNGLPTSNIYDLAQDENGFLYLGTGKGLVRYDGFSFKSMNENIENYMGGASVSIYKNDHVFFESFDGYVYHYHQKKWKNFNVNKPVHFLNYGIHKDTLFVVQKNGIDIYNINQSILLRTVNFSVGSPQYTQQIGANFYIINEDNIIKTNSRKILKSVSLDRRSPIKTIRQIYQHQDKLYIIGRSSYKEGVGVYDLNLNFLYKIDVNEINGVVQRIDFIDQKVWISSNKGIFVYENPNSKWLYKKTLFKGDNISRIIKGKNNEYWISVIGKGLYLVPNPKQFIYSFKEEKITRIICDSTGYLAGTTTGNIYKLKENLSSASFVLQNPMQTPINYMYKNNYDLFYVPSLGFHHINNKKDNFYDLALKSVAEIDYKYYVFATSSHLFLYPKKDFKQNLKPSLWDTCYERLKGKNDFAILMDGLRSKAVSYDPLTKKIYVLTNVGLFVIDENGKQEELLVNNQPLVADIMDLSIQNLFYLNYAGEVHLYLNGKSKKLDINSRVLDFKLFGSTMILKTEDGFIKYNIHNKNFEHLNFKCDPSLINDFSFHNKNLIVLMSSGIINVPQESDTQNNDFPKFIFESIKVDDNEIYSSNLSHPLEHNHNSLEINYSILDYTYSSSYTLYYNINNGDWKKLPSNSRTLQFHQLSSGQYKVSFKINNTPVKTIIQFNIKSPYWETWWFYLTISIATIILLSYYFRNRRQKLQSQIKLLEEKVELEKKLGTSLLTSIKAQMNPHFYFNALNSIQAFIYKNDKQNALDYLSKFSKLTRKILAQTEADKILLEEEISMLQLYLDLERVRFNNKFSYSINCSSKVDRSNIYIPAMLVQPYVENAVKHGFNKSTIDGLIKIIFEKNNDYLEITVEDNGIGRAQSAAFKRETKEQSFSSNANQKRLEILNMNAGKKLSVSYEDVLNNSGEVNGTRVKLFIPINL